MNKNICLLVFALVLLSCNANEFHETHLTESEHQVAGIFTSIGYYFNNQVYFIMRVIYDLFCFGVGW